MRALLLLAVLAACTAPGGPPDAGSYRDATARVASKADFDAESFAGRWHEIARYPDPATAGCANVVTDWTRNATGFDVTRACLGPDGRAGAGTRGTATLAPLGRMEVAFDGAAVPTWVLWTDADIRTAILARPDGRGAVILDRGPSLPADRRRAALEILDFNGFDTAALIFSDTP